VPLMLLSNSADKEAASLSCRHAIRQACTACRYCFQDIVRRRRRRVHRTKEPADQSQRLAMLVLVSRLATNKGTHYKE